MEVFPPLFVNRMNVIENITLAETQNQGFPLPPPSKLSERKLPESCFLSYIDQIQDGFYSSSKLVRNTPRKTSDSYFIVKTFKAEVRSYRRNYSHKSIALFRTKKEGSEGMEEKRVTKNLRAIANNIT